MKTFLLLSAALIFSIFIGLQTPYVVRSSEVFCKTSSPRTEYCMLVKKKSSDDLSLQPFYSVTGSARFFAFDTFIEGAKISSRFSLYRYVGNRSPKELPATKRKYRNRYEMYIHDCVSKLYEANLRLVIDDSTSNCPLFRGHSQLSYFTEIDKSARIICRYKRQFEPESGLQRNCSYDSVYSGWSWTIYIPTSQLVRWKPIVDSAKLHFDENFKHIDHPFIKIPFF